MTTNDHADELMKLLSAARKRHAPLLFTYAQHGRLIASEYQVKSDCRTFFHRFGSTQLLKGLTETEWADLFRKILKFQRSHLLYPPCGREAPIPECIPDETRSLFPQQ